MGTTMPVPRWLLLLFTAVSLVIIAVGEFERDKDAPLCFGVTCENGGTLDNETCACFCEEPMTGLFCEKEMLPSEWPDGTYGLPLPQYGCPETELHGWKTGYINMSVPQPFSGQRWKGTRYVSGYQYNYVNLMGPFDARHLQMNFCIKVSDQVQNTIWPSGSYCIYRVGGECADGFDSGSLTMTGYQFSISDVSGWLPDYIIERDNDSSVVSLEMFYCCRNDNQTSDEDFSFGRGWPFHMLKNSRSCPSVPEMVSGLEYFNFTSGQLEWNYTSVHPELTAYYHDAYNQSNVMLVYCYYIPRGQWTEGPDNNHSIAIRLLSKEKPLLSSKPARETYGTKNAYDGIVGNLFYTYKRPSWLQIDMQYIHKVVYMDIQISSINLQVFLSRQQWGFRSHGAVLCIGSHNRFHREMRCQRPVEAQYVTIYNMRFIYISEINIHVQGSYCGKQMGIVSGVIQDYQITSSSGKSIFNHNREFCVNSTEDNLHIQIDLLVPMVVQGLKIRGVNDTPVTSFIIRYGVSADELRNYTDPSGNQIFTVNTDTTAFKTIWLSNEILTTIIQIRFIEYQTDTCLMLELLGCPRQVSRDVMCESSSTYFGWAYLRNTRMFHEYFPARKALVATDFEQCKALCLNATSNCSFANFWKTSCRIFDIQRYNFFDTILKTRDTISGEKICLADVRDTQVCEHRIETPGILESPMYPLYYGEDTTCTWHVVFPANKTVQLHVMEIDFPAKEDPSLGDCEDKLILYDVISIDGNRSETQMRLMKEKHRQSVLFSTSNELRIVLKSCHRYSDVHVTNMSRFAINISEADLSGCGFITESNENNCTSQHGVIASPFHPSNYSLKSDITWMISGSPMQYIQVLFSSIDIPSDPKCDQAYVAVFDVQEELSDYPKLVGRYCTERPQRGLIISRWNKLQITLASTVLESSSGFSATYEIRNVDFRLKENDRKIYEHECPVGWISRGEKHCYMYFTYNKSILWIDAEHACQEHGGHLLSIEDREETRYIHYLITVVWKTVQPIFVGLFKENERVSLDDLRWTNGKAATYLDWFSDSSSKQPDGYTRERCTLIQPSSVWSTESWHDFMCAFDRYSDSICEITKDTTDGSKMINQFTCSNGNHIHFSLYCDHNIDCIDGSDEVDCEFAECRENEWSCENLQCVPETDVCDFKEDCADSSDEDVCALCIDEGFQCYEEKCIPDNRKNDGLVDCSGEYEEDEDKRPMVHSCEAWYRLGKRENGTYLVSYGGTGSFPVECRFPKQLGDKVKVIVNLKLQGRRLFPTKKTVINYEVDVKQIQMLKAVSTCKQIVSIECFGYRYSNYRLYWDASTYVDTNAWNRDDNRTVICNGESVEVLLKLPPYTRLQSEIFLPPEHLPLFAIRAVNRYVRPRSATVGPVICEENIQNVIMEEMLCKNGVIIKNHHRCLLSLDENGEVEGCRDMSHLEECVTFECPDAYVKCPDSFCIPRYLYCDGIKHCPNGADEINCANASCSGLFKCRNSSLCIPESNLCDGTHNCRHRDDELLCDIECPSGCVCEGLVLTCSVFPDLSSVSHRTRKLNITRTNAAECFLKINHMPYLGHLIIAHTNLNTIGNNTFRLSKNMLYLDLSDNEIEYINLHSFTGLNSLVFLIISGNKITKVLDEAFRKVPKLLTLDLRRNDIDTFYSGLFDGMTQLQYLYTDEYRFCCIKPGSVTKENCYPSEDEFSSCEDLMRDVTMRICLWTIGTIALVGNGLSVIYRLTIDKASLKKAHGVFVLNLCIADFLMGIYLFIIATADEFYRGRYIYYEAQWRHSIGCSVSGVIATVSSEVSTTMLCFITIDRVLAIKYPFSSIKFNDLYARVFSVFIWALNIFISTLPLMYTPYFENKFYSKSGTCLALPLTRDHPPGWQYAVVVFLGYNFLAFMVIVIGQILIYMEIRSTSATSIRKSGGQEQNIAIARNLFLIVFTDFLCWFPIAIMGLAALLGHAIPGEMYAWTTVFILPVNSALNPVLYTMNAYKQNRRNARKQIQKTTFASEIEMQRHTRLITSHAQEEMTSNLQHENDKLRLQVTALHAQIKDMGAPNGEQMVSKLQQKIEKLRFVVEELHADFNETRKTDNDEADCNVWVEREIARLDDEKLHVETQEGVTTEDVQVVETVRKENKKQQLQIEELKGKIKEMEMTDEAMVVRTPQEAKDKQQLQIEELKATIKEMEKRDDVPAGRTLLEVKGKQPLPTGVLKSKYEGTGNGR